MRNIILMLKNNFNRNIGALVLILAGLIIISCSLDAGFIFRDNKPADATGAPVGLLDQDESDLSRDLTAFLSETLNMEVNTPKSLHITENEAMSTLTDLLINKEISAIIEVPKGFESAAVSGKIMELTYTSLEDYENAAFLKIYLDTYMSKVTILSQSAMGNSDTFFRILQNSSGEVSELQYQDAHTLEIATEHSGVALGAGAFMMLSMAIAAFVALTVSDDRRTGVYYRIQMSPLKPMEYIIGTTLAGILAELLFSVGFIGIIVIKGIHTGVPVLLLAIMLFLFSLFSVGFALVIALTVNSKGMILATITSIATVLAILGGAWFPVDRQQILLSRIAALTPHYWFMELIRSIQENPQYQYTSSMIMLALFAALTYLVAAALFTKKQ